MTIEYYTLGLLLLGSLVDVPHTQNVLDCVSYSDSCLHFDCKSSINLQAVYGSINAEHSIWKPERTYC